MASELRQKIQTAIDKLRTENSSCSLALLIDGDTGLVLCKSSDAIVPQNALDALAENAQAKHKNSLVDAMTEASSESKLSSWVQVEKESVTAIIRPTQESDDALICQFDTMPDRSALFGSAREVFDLTTDAEAA